MALETASRAPRSIARNLHLEGIKFPQMVIGGALLFGALDSCSVVAPVSVKDDIYSTWGVAMGSRDRLDQGFPQYYQRVINVIPDERYAAWVNFELAELSFRSDSLLELDGARVGLLFWGFHFETVNWKQAEKPPKGVQVGSSFGERLAEITTTIKNFQRPKILGRF